MENILIVGSSGHAKVVIDIVEKEGRFNVVGLVDTFREKSTRVYGYPVLGTEADLPALSVKHHLTGALIAIGDNWDRNQMVQRIRAALPHFRFVTAVHPSAQIARGVTIGEGSVFMGGVIVNSDTRIGEHCILNTNSSIDHDSCMADFSSLAPNASTGGNVNIGAFSAVGLGANINNGITIGEHTVVGSGSLVISDIESYTLVYGLPAKVVKKRKAGEKYL